jgi:hypothetical protein
MRARAAALFEDICVADACPEKAMAEPGALAATIRREPASPA